MFHTLPRLIFGRFGRAFGVLIIVAAAWFYWWVWPEQPLRSIQMHSGCDPVMPREFRRAFLGCDGDVALITIVSADGIPEAQEHRLINLIDGADVIDSEDLDVKKRAVLSRTRPELWLFDEDNDAEPDYIKVFDYRAKNWRIPTKNQTKEYLEARDSRSYDDDKISRDRQWQVSYERSRTTEWSMLEQFVWKHLKWQLSPDDYIGIRRVGSQSATLRLPCDWFAWLGFAPGNRAWTSSYGPDGRTFILSEWDIGSKRPPWWLYALTAVGVLVIFFDFRWGRADASAKRR